MSWVTLKTDRFDELFLEEHAIRDPWQGAHYRIAAIVPCYNEEGAVGKVVRDLRHHVPEMVIYVYDNNSTDNTAREAAEAGALVRTEGAKGKGNVVRRAFGDIDADIYLLIDGDDTYDPAAAPELIRTLITGPYDHVMGVRRADEDAAHAYRPSHEFGNRLLNRIVGAIFGTDTGDMLSGYRVFSRRFVKSFPAVSREFEIETELTVHSLALRIPSTSVAVGFRDRADGTESKLRTYRDGWRILKLILSLSRHEKPIAFYSVVAALAALASLFVGLPIVIDYLATGLVPRLPSFYLAGALMGAAFLGLVSGLILDSLRKARHEVSRLAYLTLPVPSTAPVADPVLNQRRPPL
ncbi:MAG: glycosyltransferase [Nocardioides sp.]